ncbi:hypothetical protein ACWEHT_21015 [Streptomyces sp. NPDC004646]
MTGRPERSYPRVMRAWANPPVPCPDAEWLSQPEAGVTRSSADADRAWCASASRRARGFRVLKELERWF